MADNKDAPSKGSERRPGEGPSTIFKRPVSMIDLKATEVSTNPQEQDKGGAGKDRSTQATVPKTDAPPQSTADQSSTAATVAHEQAEVASSEGESVGTETATSGAQSRPRNGAAQTKRTFGYGSHVAAGVGGGLLALLGSYFLVPPSYDAPSTVGNAQQISQRLEALEGAAKERAGRIETLEADLARAGDASKSVDGLNDAHARLAAQSKALQESVTRLSSDGEPSRRIGKLEEQLSTIAAAAADPQSSGRIPHLAQITGKVSDLETALNERLAALRKDVTQDADARMAAIAEASEAARAGTQRLDREVAAARSETTRLGQRMDALKAASDRVDQALKALQGDASGLKATLDALKSDVEVQLKATAKPADVSAALAPVAGKVSALEQSLQSVVRAEADRKLSAERVVLSLQLGDLKRALDRGGGYAPELASVKKMAAAGRIDLAPLERYQHDGLPPRAELIREFRGVANAMLDADTDTANASVVDRLLSGARSIVRVRKVTHAADDASTEAIVGRMETALKENRLADVLAEAKKLPAKAAVPAYDWLKKVEARQSVAAALASIDAELKASLEGLAPGGQGGGKQ